MTKLTEGRHPGEFLLSEANGFRSREKGVIVAGSGVFAPGTVIGLVAIGTAMAAIKGGGNTGNGVLTVDVSDPVLPGAVSGTYRVTCIGSASNGGTFRVDHPNGAVLGDVAVGQTFADQIKFAIADGAADFVIGDAFLITVALGAKKYAPSPDSQVENIEGAETAVAVTLYGGDATSVDVEIAIIARDADINKSTLVYDSSVNSAPKKALKVAQLSAVGIIAR